MISDEAWGPDGDLPIRRPHWNDDLIDAVRDAVDVEFDGIWKLSEDSIRAAIAAAEDNRPPSLSDLQVQHYAEQAERAGQGLDVEALISARMEQVARAENAEAAIARVRGMAEAALAAHDELEGTYATVSAKAILNALEGGSDE